MGKVMKIVLIIVLVLVILFAGAMMFFGSYIKINEKELPSNETVIEGVNGKQALVLYQDSKHDTAKNITVDGIKVRKGNEDKIKEFVKNFLKQ